MKSSYKYFAKPGRQGAEVDPMYVPKAIKVTKKHHFRNENVPLDLVTGVLVCVNYSDYLELCLAENHKILQRIIVVTTPSDKDTLRVCSKYSNVDVIETLCFYEDGCVFDKGKAINKALHEVEKHRSSWVLIMDADIVLPINFKSRAANMKLNTATLYGAPRHFAYARTDYDKFKGSGFKDYKLLKDYYSPGNFPIGYFQLFNSMNLVRRGFSHPYPEGHNDASYTDLQFTKKFLSRGCIRDIHTIHLGPAGVNHQGRITPFFGPEDKSNDPVRNPRGRTLKDVLALQDRLTTPMFYPSLVAKNNAPASSELAIVTCYFNPHDNKNIRTNYYQFAKHVSQFARLFTVELVLDGDKPHLGHSSKTKLNVRGNREDHTLFQKECLLNIGIKYILENFDYQYICWSDADIIHSNPKWVDSCIDSLKENLIVQPFSGSGCLDHNMNLTKEKMEARNLSTARYWSFMGEPTSWSMAYFGTPHKSKSGLVWAANREFFEQVGLFWRGFIGNGDCIMVGAFTQSKRWWLVHDNKPYGTQFIPVWDAYGEQVKVLADKLGLHRMGYADNMVFHLNHGTFKKRKYTARNRSISDAGCNVLEDVELDANGLMVFTDVGKSKGLPRIVSEYFKGRHEDEFLNNYAKLQK